MKKSTYASKLGISASQLSQWLPQGLPGPPRVKAGLEWIAKNKAQRSRRGGKSSVVVKPGAKAKASFPAILGDTWPDRVARAREMERASYLAYIEAVNGGNSAQLERLQAAHVKSISTVADVEERAAKAEAGVTVIKYVDAEAVMLSALKPLREALDKLPLNERTNCNPEHPEIAERALKEWRDRLIVRAKAAEIAFKPCH